MRRVRTVLIGTLLLLAVTAVSASAGALITGARIKDGTVARVDVRNGSLTGAEVPAGGLRLDDLTGLEQGVRGIDGPPGAPGVNGAPGLHYAASPRTMSPNQQITWLSECDPGEKAIAGGLSSTRPDLVTVLRSFPDRNAWSVEVRNSSVQVVEAYAWALCVVRS
jgi:hypothetical protein